MKSRRAAELVRHLRALGHRGGTIAPHRAMWRQTLPARRLLEGLALALACSALLLVLRPWIALAWGSELIWWAQALELPGHFALGDATQAGRFGLTVPQIAPDLPAPQAWSPVWHGAALALLWWCTGWVPDAAKPIAFFVRLCVLVHAVSVVFFMFWSASFVHALGSHVASGLRQSWYLMLLMPWLHLMTYYLFPFALWRRALLTLLTLAFLFVMTPLLYALHLALAHAVGLILLPLMHLVFGVMLLIIGIVALYGWGMGWPTQ